MLFYELFTLHVKKVHGIDLHITYDSSGIFKGLMIGRTMWVKDKNIIRRMDVRSENMPKMFNDKITNTEMYNHMMDHLHYKHGFKKIKFDSIYSEKTGTWHQDVRLYSAFYILDMYKEVEDWVKEEAKELYELYKTDREEFTKQVTLLTQKLNQGKLTKKQKSKSNSIARSLDLLTNLDEEHCEYLINKYLAKDEIPLSKNSDLLTF